METSCRISRFENVRSTQLALWSFAIGTLLFVGYLIYPNLVFVMLGVGYVVFATVLNTLMLLILIDHYLALHEFRRYIAVKILLLLVNIPIALAYYAIVAQTLI